MQTNRIVNVNNKVAYHSVAADNNNVIKNKLIDSIILIKQMKDNLLTNSDTEMLLANFDKELNEYSKYLSNQHIEPLNILTQARNEAINSLNVNPNLETNEKYQAFAKIYSDTISQYGNKLAEGNSNNLTADKSNDRRRSLDEDTSNISLLMIIMTSALDMLAVNLMSSEAYARSVKLFQKASDALAMLQAMTQRMSDFYTKLAAKRQDILSKLKNGDKKYKDYKLEQFLDPGTTVSMNDKDFQILCEECGYKSADFLANGFKEFLKSDFAIFDALKEKFCKKMSNDEAMEFLGNKFRDFFKGKSDLSIKDSLRAFMKECDVSISGYDWEKLGEKFTSIVENNKTFILKDGDFPAGVEGFFKVIRDKDNKIISCVINEQGLSSMVKFVSQQVILILSDSSANPFGFLFDTYGKEGLTNQNNITNMLPAIASKSKMVQDASSSLTNQIGLCQQNVQAVVNFFDKVCDVFKQLNR